LGKKKNLSAGNRQKKGFRTNQLTSTPDEKKGPPQARAELEKGGVGGLLRVKSRG